MKLSIFPVILAHVFGEFTPQDRGITLCEDESMAMS